MKRSKSDFGVIKVDYLGHVISAGEVSIDRLKIEVVLDWPNIGPSKHSKDF